MFTRSFLTTLVAILVFAVLLPLKEAGAAELIGVDRQAVAKANGTVQIAEGIGFTNIGADCRINSYIEGSNSVTFIYLELDAGGPGIAGNYSFISTQLQLMPNGDCVGSVVYTTPFQHGRVLSSVVWNGVLDFGLGNNGSDSSPFSFIYVY
jgi:hypothetical protein